MNEATANISWLPFDPRDWVQLTPAFGRLKSVVAPHGPKLVANNHAATYFDQCVHKGLLELALVAPDFTYRQFNDAERQELHIRVPLNYKEGCNIEPHYDGHWYVRRSDLEKRTAIPVTPAARAEVEHVPARTPPVSAPPAESPRRDVDAADAPVQGTQVKLGGPQLPAADESELGACAEEPPPRPPDNAPEIEHVVWAVRFLRITEPDKLAGLRGKKLQKFVCNTVGPKFWCGLRTVQRGKKRADSM
jgi:hypothetical protein